jgi:hypothetical protein
VASGGRAGRGPRSTGSGVLGFEHSLKEEE